MVWGFLPEKMFNPNLLGLFGPDLRCNVLKGLVGGSAVVVDFLNHLVGLSRQA